MIAFLPNPLVHDTASPPIPEAQSWARRYDGRHGPLLDLCQAVPGYPPHPDMLAHLAEAAGRTESAKYGPITGDPALREAYSAHLAALYGGPVAPEQVMITAGANLAYFITLLALAKSGDAVLLPTPWYFNDQMTAQMFGIEARPLPCDASAGFVPDPDRAAALIDDRVRAIVLITPNNPTGAIYPPDVIHRFQELCARRGIWLVLDETYRDFLPTRDARPHELVTGSWPDNLIQLYSFSKSFCIPGHRLGALTAPVTLAPEIAKILDCAQICPQRAAQSAVTWGLPALAEWREQNRQEIARRAAALRQSLAQCPAWQLESLGAYFAYVRHPFADRPAAVVAEHLAAERGALCLPGSCFGPGQDHHLRIAFANIDANRLRELTARLVPGAA
jgi:aspartate/methionine/tyrosine aminotransferase